MVALSRGVVAVVGRPSILMTLGFGWLLGWSGLADPLDPAGGNPGLRPKATSTNSSEARGWNLPIRNTNGSLVAKLSGTGDRKSVV